VSYRVSFIMDQIAGHVTNYRNLRSASEQATDIEPVWHEIYYYKSGGLLERVRERMLPFLPGYFSGVLRGAWEMRSALRTREPCDAIFTNASVGVFFSSFFRRIPTMIDFDSTPLQIDRMEAYGKSSDPKPIAHLKWRLSKEMMQSATLLQAWSSWARQSAIDEYGIEPGKIVVNPPGVDLQFWRPAPTRSDAPRPFRILFVGGDFHRKGGDLLLDWYRQRKPSCELHIVTREKVETLDGVYAYYSMKPNSEELLNLYQTCDLFVLPSLGECFGIATVEAMAAGLPVIASDVGGTADIIDQGRNGFIVPNGSVQELGRAIELIMADVTLRQRMAVESRRIAEERFDLSKNARKTFAHLRQIARPRPATKARQLAVDQ